MKYYLGIDNGGTITKAALYTAQGEEIAVESIETRVYSPKPDFVERDMDEMRSTNYAVVRNLLAKSGVAAKNICGIACCGHGKGLYLVGKDGKPVRRGILSSDNRAWEYSEKWKKDGTADEVYKKTYQQILASQPVSLLAWLQDHESDIIEHIKWIFECKDYVRYCFTAEAYAELTDYSGANLINLETRDYDEELLGLFGLKSFRAALPPLKTATDVCGYVTAEAAAQTGLLVGTPVMGGMFDIDACAVAVDVSTPENICMIAGTWSINEYVSTVPIKDKSVMMNSLFCDPKYYLIEESSPTSAVNLEWFAKTFLPELIESAKQKNQSVYKYADEMVEGVDVKELCPIFFPFIMASNVHPNAKGSFIGMSYNHTRAHIIKSLYEGVAFSHKYHLEKLLLSRKEAPNCVRLAGGVANSKVWVQIFADILNQDIEVVDVKETGTLGCAMTVAVSLGDYANYSEAAKQMVTIKKKINPIAENTQIYAKRYQMYIKLLDALNPLWTDFQALC